MAGLVDFLVERARVPAVALRRDDACIADCLERLDYALVGIEGFVGEQSISFHLRWQCVCPCRSWAWLVSGRTRGDCPRHRPGCGSWCSARLCCGLSLDPRRVFLRRHYADDVRRNDVVPRVAASRRMSKLVAVATSDDVSPLTPEQKGELWGSIPTRGGRASRSSGASDLSCAGVGDGGRPFRVAAALAARLRARCRVEPDRRGVARA